MRNMLIKKKIGNATLYCGNCLKILPTLANESVDIVITDPPYSSGGMTAAERSKTTQVKYSKITDKKVCKNFYGDNRDQRSYLLWSMLWMESAMQTLKTGGILATFTDWRQLPVTSDAVQVVGLVWRGVGVWAKKSPRPQQGRYTNACEYVVWGTKGDRKLQGQTAPGIVIANCPPTAIRRHITEKPVEVCEWLLSVTNDGDTVLDPFMGSGSLGVACQKTNRRYIGIEMSRHYFNIAVERLKKVR